MHATPRAQHADLKLENVMLDIDESGAEVVEVIDVGLASKALPTAMGASTTAYARGSLKYMGPELESGPNTCPSDLCVQGDALALLPPTQPMLAPPRIAGSLSR